MTGKVLLFTNTRLFSEDIPTQKQGIASDLGEIPQFKRGMVWCRKCGKSQRVDAVVATLGDGWPKCCGYTMTIDSPEEQAKFEASHD